MAEPPFYIWSSNGGCEACDALSGLHLLPPRRPHPNCRCTITPYTSPESGGGDLPNCSYDEHLLLSLTHDGSGTVYNWEEEQYDRLVIQAEFTVMCKDGSIVDGEYVYEEDVQTDRLPFSNLDDLATYGDMVLDKALDQWESEADKICPVCR